LKEIKILDITWIKDKSPTDLEDLPDPDVLANDILENLKSVIQSFEEVTDEFTVTTQL
jgi:type I restriction enzyme M protein